MYTTLQFYGERLLVTIPSKPGAGEHLYDLRTGEVVPQFRNGEGLVPVTGLEFVQQWSHRTPIVTDATVYFESVIREIASCYSAQSHSMRVNTAVGVMVYPATVLPWIQIGAVHISAHTCGDEIKIMKTISIGSCDLAWSDDGRWGVDAGPASNAAAIALRAMPLTAAANISKRKLEPWLGLKWSAEGARLMWNASDAVGAARHAVAPNATRLNVLPAAYRGLPPGYEVQHGGTPTWWVLVDACLAAVVSASPRAVSVGLRAAMRIAEVAADQLAFGSECAALHHEFGQESSSLENGSTAPRQADLPEA